MQTQSSDQDSYPNGSGGVKNLERIGQTRGADRRHDPPHREQNFTIGVSVGKKHPQSSNYKKESHGYRNDPKSETLGSEREKHFQAMPHIHICF